MDESKFYTIVMLGVTLAAIIAPLATAIINNLHESRIKEIELKREQRLEFIRHERDAFEDYVGKAGAAIRNLTMNTIEAYGGAYRVALLYMPQQIRDRAQILDYCVSRNSSDAAQELDEVAAMLHDYIEPRLSQPVQAKARRRNTRRVKDPAPIAGAPDKAQDQSPPKTE